MVQIITIPQKTVIEFSPSNHFKAIYKGLSSSFACLIITSELHKFFLGNPYHYPTSSGLLKDVPINIHMFSMATQLFLAGYAFATAENNVYKELINSLTPHQDNVCSISGDVAHDYHYVG